MRLIDADALKKVCNSDIAALLDATPTVDAVVLPFHPGDDMWFVDEEQNNRILCEEGGIRAVLIGKDRKPLMVNKDGLTFKAGKEGVFLTKEAAEDYVKAQEEVLSWVSLENS